MSHPWREQFLKMMTASNADQENLAPEVIKGKKQFIAGATSVRQPLKDNTNCNSSSKDVRPVVDRKEPSTLEADSLYIAPSQCSIAAHEEIELDSEGFVIWEDSTQHSSSPEDEVRVLREALSATLEENRMLHSKLAIFKVDHGEIKRLKEELNMVYSLYSMAKTELEEAGQ